MCQLRHSTSLWLWVKKPTCMMSVPYKVGQIIILSHKFVDARRQKEEVWFSASARTIFPTPLFSLSFETTKWFPFSVCAAEVEVQAERERQRQASGAAASARVQVLHADVPFNPPSHDTTSIRSQWGLKQEEQLCDSLLRPDTDVPLRVHNPNTSPDYSPTAPPPSFSPCVLLSLLLLQRIMTRLLWHEITLKL